MTAAFFKMKSEGPQGWKLGRCGDKRDSGDLWKLPGRVSATRTLRVSEKRERLLFVPCETETVTS